MRSNRRRCCSSSCCRQLLNLISRHENIPLSAHTALQGVHRSCVPADLNHHRIEGSGRNRDAGHVRLLHFADAHGLSDIKLLKHYRVASALPPIGPHPDCLRRRWRSRRTPRQRGNEQRGQDREPLHLNVAPPVSRADKRAISGGSKAALHQQLIATSTLNAIGHAAIPRRRGSGAADTDEIARALIGLRVPMLDKASVGHRGCSGA